MIYGLSHIMLVRELTVCLLTNFGRSMLVIPFAESSCYRQTIRQLASVCIYRRIMLPFGIDHPKVWPVINIQSSPCAPFRRQTNSTRGGIFSISSTRGSTYFLKQLKCKKIQGVRGGTFEV